MVKEYIINSYRTKMTQCEQINENIHMHKLIFFLILTLLIN